MTTGDKTLTEQIAGALAEVDGYGPTDMHVDWVMRYYGDFAVAVLPIVRTVERRAIRAEAQAETRRQQTKYWQERAEGFEARIQAVEAEIERHEKHLGLDPLIPADRLRRALDAP